MLWKATLHPAIAPARIPAGQRPRRTADSAAPFSSQSGPCEGAGQQQPRRQAEKEQIDTARLRLIHPLHQREIQNQNTAPAKAQRAEQTGRQTGEEGHKSLCHRRSRRTPAKISSPPNTRRSSPEGMRFIKRAPAHAPTKPPGRYGAACERKRRPLSGRRSR